MRKTDRILEALKTLGGKANNRQIADIANAGYSGDVATILSSLAKQGRVRKLGYEQTGAAGPQPSLWEII